MPHGAPADEGLGHLADSDRALNACRNAELLDRCLEGQGVDDRAHHPHLVGDGTIDFPLCAEDIAPNEVAATNDDRGGDAETLDVDDFTGDVGDGPGVEAEPDRARQSLPADLQKYTTKDGLDHGVDT